MLIKYLNMKFSGGQNSENEIWSYIYNNDLKIITAL
jgi:hypothetical protein